MLIFLLLGVNVEFTGIGYARLTSGSILTLPQLLRVPITGTYDFIIRYTLSTSNTPISLTIVLNPRYSTTPPQLDSQTCMQQVTSLTAFPLNNIQAGVSMIVEYKGVCLNSQINYKIELEPASANYSFIDIDSFVVIPSSPLSTLAVFNSNFTSLDTYIQNCVELRKSLSDWMRVNYSFCDPITLSASAELYSSLQPCLCNSNGSTNLLCGVNGQCHCYAGVGSDRVCSRCLPGYHSLIPNVGCSICSCNSTGSISGVCNISNGACSCLPNVGNTNCDACNNGSYNFTAGIGCTSCDCNQLGSDESQCGADGVCACKPGVTGDKCEMCLHNYYGLNMDGCYPCDCDFRGVSLELICDKVSGACNCKSNVVGRRCDQCTSGHINLQTANPYGCQPCYCSDRSDVCTEARGFIQGEVCYYLIWK